jgi:multidrug efflux pump subunit AcrA (membrane-fusion protein)
VLLVEPESSQVAAREVKLGPIGGDRVEVSEGLDEGDLLIIRGHDRVVVGDRVKYQREGPASAAQTD